MAFASVGISGRAGAAGADAAMEAGTGEAVGTGGPGVGCPCQRAKVWANMSRSTGFIRKSITPGCRHCTFFSSVDRLGDAVDYFRRNSLHPDRGPKTVHFPSSEGHKSLIVRAKILGVCGVWIFFQITRDFQTDKSVSRILQSCRS